MFRIFQSPPSQDFFAKMGWPTTDILFLTEVLRERSSFHFAAWQSDDEARFDQATAP